jgi:uncharacterized repeat protein (TIGR03803 family)
METRRRRLANVRNSISDEVLLMRSKSVSRVALKCAAFGLLAVLLGSSPALRAQTGQSAPTPPTAVINDFANVANGDGTAAYGVMQASDGNFYLSDGSATTILRVTPVAGDASGTISTLAGQLAAACGNILYGNLIEASDGNLYGFTLQGGTNNNGTFFKYVISTRTCTPLYNVANATDGYSFQSDGGLTYGSDGNFYGTFLSYGPNNKGTAFRITPAGVFTVLYTFCSAGGSACSDGAYPTGRMVEASDGNWYGVTQQGGSGANQGVFFQLVPGVTTPWIENPLYNMAAATGYAQDGPMVEGPDGMLYASLVSGGANDGDGSIGGFDFQGDFMDFYDFTNTLNEEEPQGLFVGGDGNLYGSTVGYSTGSIFQITPGTGIFTDLGVPAGGMGVGNPDGPIIQASDGNFYGTTNNDGTKALGTIYQAVVSSTPAAPIVVTLSSSTFNGSAPITVSYKVTNATSKTARNCYLYTQAGGGTFTGKATGTQSGSTLSGSANVTPTATGTFTYAVECAGTYAGISPVLTVTGLSAAATQTVLKVSPNPVVIGNNVTLTATVSRTSASGTPTGSVSFEYRGGVLATVTLNGSGVATLPANTGAYGPATYPVTAHYNPDSADMASVSNTVGVVLKYGTKTTLSVTPNPVTVGSNVTITVHVTQNTGTGTPAGTITILANGGPVINNVNLTNGSVVITAPTTGFPKGTYQISAQYNGSATDNVSTSAVQSETLD